MAAAELGRRLHAEPKQKRINISSPGASHRFVSDMRGLKKEKF